MYASSLPFKEGKKGTETYPAITIAKSEIIHSLQFFELNPYMTVFF